ncbi:MAG: ComEA family DNA-binding protein [Candidatus Bipolaricaulia bacterium]
MVFSRSDRLILGALLALALLGAGGSYLVSSVHHLPPVDEEPLDLNEASFSELLGLPGIGPKLAERIVRYRERHGPFNSLEELLNVEGIGPKLLQRLEGRLTVGGSAGDHDP